MMKRIGWMLVLALGLLAGCSSSGHGEQEDKALRVGVMPDYPPLVFREDGKVVGLERDFAEQLSSDLEHPLSLHEYTQLSDLFAALKNNEERGKVSDSRHENQNDIERSTTKLPGMSKSDTPTTRLHSTQENLPFQLKFDATSTALCSALHALMDW